MAKVLRYDSPQVKPEATPQVRFNVDNRSGAEELSQGIRRLSSGVDAIAQERDRAVAAKNTGVEYDFQADITHDLEDDKEGLFRKEGEAALDQEGPVLGNLEKKRQAHLEKIADPRAKAIFDARSRGMFEDARRQVERHIGKQREVIADVNLNVAIEGAKDALSKGDVYNSPESRAFQIARPEASIRALAKSKEHGELLVQKWRREADKIVLEKYIKSGDVEGADAYFTQAKDRLGPEAPEVEARIQRELNATKGQRHSATLALEHLNEGGWIDANAALNKAEAMPETSPSEIDIKKQTITHLQERINRSDSKRKRAGEEALNELKSIYRTEGTTNTTRGRDLKEWMNKKENQAAGLLDGFLARVERDKKIKANDAGARREQKALNKRIYATFDALDDDVQLATDVEAFGEDADDTTIEEMRKLQKEAREKKERGGRVTGSEAKAAAKGDVETKSIMKGADKETSDDYVHRVADWARRFEVEHKRPPSEGELQEARDKALIEVVVPRLILPDKKVPGYTVNGMPAIPPAPKAQPAPKPTARGTKPTAAQRIGQLRKEEPTLSREQIKARLQGEGYTFNE